MEKIIPISDLQSKAKQYVEQVMKTDQPLIITQRGRAAAVLVSCDSYEGFVATQEEMSFSDWKRRLARAEKEIASHKTAGLDSVLKKRKKPQ